MGFATKGQCVAARRAASGSYAIPDATINADTGVTIEIAAENIPVGTQVQLTLVPDNGDTISVESTPLASVRAASTASAGPIVIPHGFSKFFVNATWDP